MLVECIFGDLKVLSETQRSYHQGQIGGMGQKRPIRRDKRDQFEWSWKENSDTLKRKVGYLKRIIQQMFTEHLLCAGTVLRVQII